MRLVWVAALFLGAACSSGGSGGGGSPGPAIPTLPAGSLRSLVVQPGDVQHGLVPLTAQTGPADLDRIAGFSADPAAAAASLRSHGFTGAYVVQYADPETHAVVTNVVTQFASEDGATADLTADLSAAAGTGATFEVIGLGEQSGGVRGVLDAAASASSAGSLVTLRWRIDDTTWLLAVGAAAQVDEAGVRRLADLLVTRFRPLTVSPS